MAKLVFGLDIGGTGIKGGIVDVSQGKLITEKRKILTPKPATPDAVLEVVKELVDSFDWKGPIGCGFPAVMKNGVCHTATNLSKEWIGKDVAKLIQMKTGGEAVVINDADAAALCEVKSGAAKGKKGTVMLLTIGTGIGSGLVRNGILVPNIEVTPLMMPNGLNLELYGSNVTRIKEKMNWHVFGSRIDHILEYLERIFAPDLFILGGGVSKEMDAWGMFLKRKTPVVTTLFQNDSGAIGGALAYVGK
jgi:polyphosphate glucokinase